MVTTEIRNSNAAVTEQEVRALNSKVAQQVSDILEEASQQESARQPVRPAMVYRVPAPGVRYYF